MPYVLIGLFVLVLVLWGSKSFVKADPRLVARTLKSAGGIGALIAAAFLTLRGQLGLALPVGIAGLAMLGLLPRPAGFWQRTQKSSGQTSRVRSAFVEMELDHDTGAMQGRILAGTHEGVSLDALPVPTLIALMPGIDPESRALLAAYLDRREPTWREHADQDAGPGRSGSARSSGPMTDEEAYQILGVEPGASAAEIGRAHRSLMKKLHPDQGGSTYLAARINEAKDVLLRRHR
jgi:hypothetical protein